MPKHIFFFKGKRLKKSTVRTNMTVCDTFGLVNNIPENINGV